MILGVDPGTTTGLAALDLRGNLLLLLSKKSADDAWIVSAIRNVGVPVLVATDVVPAPARVEKIAAQFGARLWTPSSKIRVAFKESVARKYDNAPKDDHQRDALSAAYAAFLQFAGKFRHIDAQYGHDPDLADYLKRAVVFGTSVSQALDEWVQGEHPKRFERVVTGKRGKEDVAHLHEVIADLKRKLSVAERKHTSLSKKVRTLQEENRRLKRLLEYVPSDERYHRMRMERDAAKRDLARMRERYRAVLDALNAVGRGEAEIIPLSDVRSGKILASTDEFAVVVPEDDSEDAEELARRIMDLVEDYRRNRS